MKEGYYLLLEDESGRQRTISGFESEEQARVSLLALWDRWDETAGLWDNFPSVAIRRTANDAQHPWRDELIESFDDLERWLAYQR